MLSQVPDMVMTMSPVAPVGTSAMLKRGADVVGRKGVGCLDDRGGRQATLTDEMVRLG